MVETILIENFNSILTFIFFMCLGLGVWIFGHREATGKNDYEQGKNKLRYEKLEHEQRKVLGPGKGNS